MLFNNRGEVLFKGSILLPQDTDWENIAKQFELLQSAASIRIIPERAIADNEEAWLPFIGRGRLGDLNEIERVPGQRNRLSGEEQIALFFKTLVSDLEGLFDAPVEVKQVDFNMSDNASDDYQEIKKIFERSIFGMRSVEFSADNLKPEITNLIHNPMKELDSLIGLQDVKDQIKKIVSLVDRSGRDNLPCLHMVFRGNPGTGKTTVARIVGQIYSELGVVSKDDVFVEVGREGLVAPYVGHTALKTKHQVEKAKGGVLFIDEAYSLGIYDNHGHDFGPEAIATLVKEMEDSRNDFVCIMAGYSEPMDKMIDINPGLRDRIGFYVDFPDYSAEELCQVFEKFAADEGYELDELARSFMEEIFFQLERNKDDNFSNGRLVRKIYERVRMNHITESELGDKEFHLSDFELAFSDRDLDQLLHKQATHPIGFVC